MRRRRRGIIESLRLSFPLNKRKSAQRRKRRRRRRAIHPIRFGAERVDTHTQLHP
jgi:hypothetical protein